jgi:uncharacterized membrane protein YbhN (UPF0104 family)
VKAPRNRPSLLERAGTAAAGISSVGAGNPRKKALVQYGLAALIFGCLVFFVARQWNELPDFEWRFSPAWLALAIVCVTLFYALQGELWRVVIHLLGEHIDAGPGRAVWGKSLLARYVPTNVLMVLGRVVMAERCGVPKRVTLASVLYELAFALGTAVMVGAYFVIQLPDLEGQPARYAVLTLIPLVLVVVHPRVFQPLIDFALGKLGREPLPRVLPFGRVLALCLAYVGCWATIGLGLYAFVAALHPVDLSDLPYIASSYPVAFCVAVLTFVVPSGIGTRDAALATAMAVVLPGAVATAIAVAFRILQTLIELLYVGVVVALDRAESSGPNPLDGDAKDSASMPNPS